MDKPKLLKRTTTTVVEELVDQGPLDDSDEVGDDEEAEQVEDDSTESLPTKKRRGR